MRNRENWKGGRENFYESSTLPYDRGVTLGAKIANVPFHGCSRTKNYDTLIKTALFRNCCAKYLFRYLLFQKYPIVLYLNSR